MRASTAADRDRLADVQHRPASSRNRYTPGSLAARRNRVGARRQRRGRRCARSVPSAGAPRARAPRPTVPAFAHSRGNIAHSTRPHDSASASARCAAGPRSRAHRRAPLSRALTLERQHRLGASAAVQMTGGSGQSRPIRSNAPAQHAAVERRVGAPPAPGLLRELLQRRQDGLEARGIREHLLRDPGEPLNSPAERPVALHQRVTSGRGARHRRPTPRPTSVISHASPPRPLVSVSTTRNSALATGCSSNVMHACYTPSRRTASKQDCSAPRRICNR